jgi:hypothetical protein
MSVAGSEVAAGDQAAGADPMFEIKRMREEAFTFGEARKAAPGWR